MSGDFYGDFMLFDEAGKLEKGERVYLGDVKGKNEGWLRDTLFDHPEIRPIKCDGKWPDLPLAVWISRECL